MTWSGINFCLFSNPHFPQLQNHSFDLQNHKMSQSHTYFRPCWLRSRTNDLINVALKLHNKGALRVSGTILPFCKTSGTES